jgi:hypothetical protein
MSIKEYFLLFFAVAAINGVQMTIYVAFVDRGRWKAMSNW